MNYSIDTLNNIQLEGHAQPFGDEGVGNLLILLVIFQQLEKGNLLVDDAVVVSEAIAGEKKNLNCLGFEQGEEWLLSDLIQLQVLTGAPDCALLLAKLFREQVKKSAQKAMDAFVLENKLTENCCKNVSGRRKKSAPQSYTINDIKRIGQAFSTLPSEYHHYFTVTEKSFKGELLKGASTFFQEKRADFGLFWNKKNGFLIDGNQLLIVLDAENEFELNEQFYCLLNDQEETKHKANQGKVFSKSNVSVAIVGDTYMGEWYAAHRKRLGRWDPIIDEGYDYSFREVESMINNADFTIANLEAVLVNDPSDSPLKRIKKFVLGGDKEETTAVLKRQGIDLVTLATNHIGDFGQAGVQQTVQSLKEKKIAYIGSGETVEEASQPFRLKTRSQEVFIFNAYWYKRYQYRSTNTYAIGENLGAACISTHFCEKIKAFKAEHPNAKIVVIAHWGVDFRPILNYQRANAKRLADAGADLILGHGPHALQAVGKIDATDIFYSLGNFVFNSDGEYKAHPKALPYGGIVTLNFKGKSLYAAMKFIETNNLKTQWIPKEVTSEEFQEIVQAFEKEKFQENGWEVNESEKEITKKLW